MINELKIWLHKQRDYYLDRINDENLKKIPKFGVLELEFLEGKVAFCENVLEFIEEELEPRYKDDLK